MDLGEGHETVRVGGVGGCFGPKDLERQSKHLQGYAKRHYTRDEIEMLCKGASVDILLVHDAPAGVRFERHRQGIGWVSEAAGLDQLVAGVRPKSASSATITRASMARWPGSAASGSTRCACRATSWRSTSNHVAECGHFSASGPNTDRQCHRREGGPGGLGGLPLLVFAEVHDDVDPEPPRPNKSTTSPKSTPAPTISKMERAALARTAAERHMPKKWSNQAPRPIWTRPGDIAVHFVLRAPANCHLQTNPAVEAARVPAISEACDSAGHARHERELPPSSRIRRDRGAGSFPSFQRALRPCPCPSRTGQRSKKWTAQQGSSRTTRRMKLFRSLFRGTARYFSDAVREQEDWQAGLRACVPRHGRLPSPRGRDVLVPGRRLRQELLEGRCRRVRRDLPIHRRPCGHRTLAIGERSARVVLFWRARAGERGEANGLFPHHRDHELPS